MVRQSGPDEGDDQQGWKFCDAYLQSSAALANLARRSCCRQTAGCSGDANSKSRRRAECACTEIASECAARITTTDPFAGVDAATHAWNDSAEPTNDKGIRWRN